MEERYEEGLIKGAIGAISLQKVEIIIDQMKKYICKVFGDKIGTGFFCRMPYKNDIIPVMITNYHVIDDNFIEKNKQLKISLNEKYYVIKLNENSRIYSSVEKKYDIMIIKIQESEINNFLEFDQNLFMDNSESLYINESIYILHYPNSDKAAVSFGYGIEKISDFDIKHLCNTENGSSGGPILNLQTNKIIGIHKGFIKKQSQSFNIGSFLKFPFNEIKGFSLNNENINKNINLNEQKTEKRNIIDINLLNEFKNFVNDTLEGKELKKALMKNLEDILFSLKIQIPFNGELSVGKSTILNCIIGEEILPTKETECTSKGIRIRHVEDNDFKLYKAKFEKNSNNSFICVRNEYPQCFGIKNIKKYLEEINNEKIINNDNAFHILTGKLKIFDLIKLDKELASKIEFIDLPGNDRKDKSLSYNYFYNKIICNSNVYVSDSRCIDDYFNIKEIINLYEEHKMHFDVTQNFFKTCIYLINKSDLLNDDVNIKDVETLLRENIFKKISQIDNNFDKKDIHISFFSGMRFIKYLDIMKNYVYLLEKHPGTLVLNLYNENNQKYQYIGFEKFVKKKISYIEEFFELDDEDDDEEEEEENPPDNLKIKLKSEIESNGINCKKISENLDLIFKKLFNLSIKLKNKDFSNTIYYPQFFFELKKIIEYSEKFIEERFIHNSIVLLKNTDKIFEKKIGTDIYIRYSNIKNKLKKSIGI